MLLSVRIIGEKGMLSEEMKSHVDVEVERIRDIADYIRQTTNIGQDLIFDMANVIYLKTKY